MTPSPSSTTAGAAPAAVTLALPFTGLWLAQNSPARRVPSHGTDLLGERYAIDFVAVDQRRRTAGGSSRVAVGDTVTAGQPIAQCGNSGNSTQPPRGSKQVLLRQSGLPGEGVVVEPLDQRTDLRL